MGVPVEVVLPCENCSPTSVMELDEHRARLRCAGCGNERDFSRRPFYLITGPPGAGKTSVALRLAGRIDRLPIVDTDLFGDAAHPEWSSWATTWLLVAHGLASSGLSVVLCGYGLHRTQIEPLPARRLLGEAHSLNLDLPDDELRARLQRRTGYDTARIERKVAFAARLREEADVNVGTAGMSVEEVTAAVERWLRDHMAAQVDPG